MWAEAAKWVAKYPEGVLNAIDDDGYPLSVRQTALPYEPSTGSMPVILPEAMGATEGPASLLCHFHDEKLWNLRAILLKGRLERRDGQWIFVTTSFAPPSMWQMITGFRRSMKSYLEKRGLPVPQVNYAAIEGMWREAREVRDP